MKLLSKLLLLVGIVTAVMGFASPVSAQSAGELGGEALGTLNLNCNLITPWGSAMVSCGDATVVKAMQNAGRSPAQFSAVNCYNVSVSSILGQATVDVQNVDCTGAPFNRNYKLVECANGIGKGAPGEPDAAICAKLNAEEATKKAEEQAKKDAEEAAKKLAEGAQETLEQNKATTPSDVQRQECTNPDECLKDNELIKFIKVAVNIMSALVGVVVTAMIVLGGIQYASAGGSPNATSAAKKRIFNAIFALIAYLFLFVILEWLLPGGLF